MLIALTVSACGGRAVSTIDAAGAPDGAAATVDAAPADPCQALEQRYQGLLARARRCTPGLARCTVLVPASAIEHATLTLVSAEDADAVGQLAAIERAASTLCGTIWSCGLIATSARCEASPAAGGRCVVESWRSPCD